MGVVECVKHELVEPFNVLWEREGDAPCRTAYVLIHRGRFLTRNSRPVHESLANDNVRIIKNCNSSSKISSRLSGYKLSHKIYNVSRL